MTRTSGGQSDSESAVVTTFGNYFAAFMHGSIDELGRYAALPFLDVRGGELTSLRSESQLEDFRRGLRARMAKLGFASGSLKEAHVLMVHRGTAVVQFENTRNGADGAVKGGTHSLAFMQCEEGTTWRVWMIAVLKAYETD